MIAFFDKFKEVAARETRTMTLPGGMIGLPAGEYALVEFYSGEDPAYVERLKRHYNMFKGAQQWKA